VDRAVETLAVFPDVARLRDVRHQVPAHLNVPDIDREGCETHYSQLWRTSRGGVRDGRQAEQEGNYTGDCGTTRKRSGKLETGLAEPREKVGTLPPRDVAQGEESES